MFLVLAVAFLAGCGAAKKRPVVIDATVEERVRFEITSDLVVRTEPERRNAVVYGVVIENKAPASGVIFFTEESTGKLNNEFISMENARNGRYSITLEPGIYKVQITSDQYRYEIGKLEFKAGEVREINISLEGDRVYE